MSDLKIEIRFAVLINLLILLWYAIAFMIGIQEEPLIAYSYIFNIVALLTIVIISCNLAISAKRELSGNELTFRQIFSTVALLSFFAALLSCGSELIFNKLINPDFLEARIAHALKVGKAKDYHEAAMVLNMIADIVATALGIFVLGLATGLLMALRMRTEKQNT